LSDKVSSALTRILHDSGGLQNRIFSPMATLKIRVPFAEAANGVSCRVLHEFDRAFSAWLAKEVLVDKPADRAPIAFAVVT